MSMKIVTEQMSPKESPTRYMLPEQVNAGGGTGLVDYSLNEHSLARYPIATNKKKRKSQNKESKKKSKTGNTIQYKNNG